MGRGGVYFRSTLPSTPRYRPPREAPDEFLSPVDFKEIESGSVTQMVDSSSAELLSEINAKARKLVLWPWVLGLSICLVGLLIFVQTLGWTFFVVAPVCAAAVVGTAYWDKLRKTLVLLYQLEPHMESAYQGFHDAFGKVSSCSRVWHIQSQGSITNLYDRKTHAGASALVRRKKINPHAGSPPYFKSNISIPSLPVGRQTLYFLPDRILVWDTDGVGAVGYDQLAVNFEDTRFVETEWVPSDSRVVDQTWKYVNKSGGPDRRFNDNAQIPVVLYEGILLSSRSGLQEMIQTSKTGIGTILNESTRQMASAIALRDEAKAGYFKCPCKFCRGLIEYPQEGLGQTVDCPHCGARTVLTEH